MLKYLREMLTLQNFALVPLIGLWIAILGSIAWEKISPTPATVVVTKPRHPDIILMDEVRKVNADASSLMLSSPLSMGLDVPVSCMVADGLSKDPQSGTNPVFWALIEKQLAECDFSKIAKSGVYRTFDSIAASGVLPKEAFAFEVFADEKWAIVGLFNGLDACKELLKEAMERGIGVKSCELWKPRY